MGCSGEYNRQIRRLIANICLTWLLLLVGSMEGSAQISPGELSKAHSFLNGPSHCTDCHDTRIRPPEFKCLNCHRDIRERLTAKKGLHPTLVGADKTQRACVKCHSDHNGGNFDLIHWDVPIRQFDHRKTGYPLEGKHSQVDCRNCHQAAHIPATARESILVKDLSRTYLGLSRNCLGCHADVHQGQLSMECEGCHTLKDWKNPERFDHRKARFALDKTHEKVPCTKCHGSVSAANPVIKYKGISFEDCSPCHHDPHENAFRTACRTCHHSNVPWKAANASAVFKHSQTRFPLLGKHAEIACDTCHLHGDFKKPLAFARCRDCHRDPHGGQFATHAKGGDCDECHTVQEDFRHTIFGVAQHNDTLFPLKERHLEIQCSECHTPKGAVVVYRIQEFSCIACHQDVHGSQFAGVPYRNRCESCHSQRAFKPSTYTIAQHSGTRFPLLWGHIKVSCDKCHKATSKPVKFLFEDRACTVCHEDPHRGEFADRMAAALSNGSIAGCEICHTTNTWHELDKFDHATTRFPLEGAHRKVSCDKCHKPANIGGGVKDIIYRSASRECAGCHDDPHKGQFASQMAVRMSNGNPAGCRGCHNTVSWKELTGFDHSTTAFPLEGAHNEVACAKCHPSTNPKGDVSGINYTAAPRRCPQCHEDIHGGQFSSGTKEVDCTRCHQVQKWIPSTFDHDRQSSFKLEGAHRSVRCPLCHTNIREVAGKKVLFYRPTAHECAACHGSNPTGK